jgi:tRNA nucleotidyltransferase (CCA-adding enzyme)
MKILKIDQDLPQQVAFLRGSRFGKAIHSVFNVLNKNDIEAYVVGGFVRDLIFNVHTKDIDIEVFGCSGNQLRPILELLGKVDLVGEAFGVYKLTLDSGVELDISLARRENRIGAKHTDFEIILDETLTPEEAVQRRDFTINALYYDPLKMEIIDYVDGLQDAHLHSLRHINDDTFIEDPLRVLRGFQMCGRLELVGHPNTIELCRSMMNEYSSLSLERVREEWKKWAVKSETPSYGLRFLLTTDWVCHYSELYSLVRWSPQDVVWHPEGRDLHDETDSRNDSAWIHTQCVCDAMASEIRGFRPNEVDEEVLMMAALCHDLGKAVTTKIVEKNGRITYTSVDHELAGIHLTESFLKSIGYGPKFIRKVTPLVEFHMAHTYDPNTNVKKAAEKLAYKLSPHSNLKHLAAVCRADCAGRPPCDPCPPKIWTEIEEYAESVGLMDSIVAFIVDGHELQQMCSDLNVTLSGAQLGSVLHDLHNAQLNQKYFDLTGAKDWLRQHLNKGQY